jgi:hypothetical protein
MQGVAPVTRYEAQKHAQALGYPWIARGKDQRWRCFQTEPRLNRMYGHWEAGGNALGVLIDIEYNGTWEKSKTGPGRRGNREK